MRGNLRDGKHTMSAYGDVAVGLVHVSQIGALKPSRSMGGDGEMVCTVPSTRGPTVSFHPPSVSEARVSRRARGTTERDVRAAKAICFGSLIEHRVVTSADPSDTPSHPVGHPGHPRIALRYTRRNPWGEPGSVTHSCSCM